MQAASTQTCQDTYLPQNLEEGYNLLLSNRTDFSLNWLTLSRKRGAERNTIRIVRIVVVVIAVAVDIHEITRVVAIRRTQPPVRRRRRQTHTTYRL